MTKELRVAKVVPEVADSNCPAAPEQKLTIEHPDHGTVSYYLTGTDLYREAGGTANIINSSAVQVTKLGFCISGGKSGDGKQTRVTILLGMQSVKSKEQAVVESQTTLSLRSLND